MRDAIMPVLLGWMLSVWLPVPGLVRQAAGTAMRAVENGVRAVAVTLKPK